MVRTCRAKLTVSECLIVGSCRSSAASCGRSCRRDPIHRPVLSNKYFELFSFEVDLLELRQTST